MKIITAEGKIVEGYALTENEVSIFSELNETSGPLGDLYTTTRAKAAGSIIASYNITRRTPPTLADDPTAEPYAPFSEVA